MVQELLLAAGMRRYLISLLICLAPGLGSACGSTAKTGVSTSNGSCVDSSGAIATTAKACTSASDCRQAVEPMCCAPVMEVGLAKSSSCTFPTPSCTNLSCPIYTHPPEQAEDGKDTVPGGSIGLACVSGQCVTFVVAGDVDAGKDVGPCPAEQFWCPGCARGTGSCSTGGCPDIACPAQDSGCTGSACSYDAGTSPASDTGTSDILSCVDWYRFPIPNTNNVLINNVWNKQHAGITPYRQCLTERNASGGTQYGWSWDWPPCDTATSFAAPEVMFGRKPWDGGASTSPSLPKRIDAIQGLLVDFGVGVVGDACYNLNTTMWLTRSDAAPTDPDPQDVTTEVMVRFNDAGNIRGCCTLDGNVTLGGIAFQVWHQDVHADASGTTTNTWKMVIYENSTPITDTQFDLALVLKDMVSRSLIEATNAVQGVELITEVSGGSGKLWLNRFNVAVQ